MVPTQTPQAREKTTLFCSVANKFPGKDLLFLPTEELRGNIHPFGDPLWEGQPRRCSVLRRLRVLTAAPLAVQPCDVPSAIRMSRRRSLATPSSRSWGPARWQGAEALPQRESGCSERLEPR